MPTDLNLLVLYKFVAGTELPLLLCFFFIFISTPPRASGKRADIASFSFPPVSCSYYHGCFYYCYYSCICGSRPQGNSAARAEFPRLPDLPRVDCSWPTSLPLVANFCLFLGSYYGSYYRFRCRFRFRGQLGCELERSRER